MKPSELPWHEIIGLKCKVVWSKNKDCIGIEGKIVDETRNTILIRTEKGIKRILKEICVFEFDLGNVKVYIPGEILVGRPEERLKKRIKVRKSYFELLLKAIETKGLKKD